MTSGMSSRQRVEYDGQSVGIRFPTLDVGSWNLEVPMRERFSNCCTVRNMILVISVISASVAAEHTTQCDTLERN